MPKACVGVQFSQFHVNWISYRLSLWCEKSFYITLCILRQHTEALTGNVILQDSVKFVVWLNCNVIVMSWGHVWDFFKLTAVVFKNLTEGSVITQISLVNFFCFRNTKKLQKQTILSKIRCRSLCHNMVPAISAMSTSESLVHSASLCWKACSVKFRSLKQYWSKTMGYQVHEFITKYCKVVYCLLVCFVFIALFYIDVFDSGKHRCVQLEIRII